MQTRRRPGLACLACLLLSCASAAGAPHPNLATVWRQYEKLQQQRALAVAGDPTGNRWVTGASGGHTSIAEAEEGALIACRQRRKARRLRAECRVYAIGTEILWTTR